MKMKRTLVLALLVVATAVGSYLLVSERGDLEGLALTDPKAFAVKPTVANPVERLESQNRVAVVGFLQKLDQSIQETRSRQAVLGVPDDGAKTREPMLEKDMAQVFASTFPEIKKVGTMVNRDELPGRDSGPAPGATGLRPDGF